MATDQQLAVYLRQCCISWCAPRFIVFNTDKSYELNVQHRRPNLAVNFVSGWGQEQRTAVNVFSKP